MITQWILAAIVALGAAYLVAAVQEKPLTFDAASVKPASVLAGVTIDGSKMTVRKGSGSTIPRNTGGPGTDDPGRIHYPLISLKELLKRAWDSYYEIEGPGWLDTQAVTVDATMPPGTTKDQFQEMLRNLITDRFAFKYHNGTKEVAGYTLAVAKSGSKMKVSADQNESAIVRPPAPAKRGPDGFPIIPPGPGHWLVSFGMGDRSRTVGQQQTMQDLAQWLARTLKTIVTDATGLPAKYDFTVTYAGGIEPGEAVASTSSEEPLPDIFSALQSQLGLKLETKKVPVEVLAVDHMEKTPKEN